jgi:hypothetical protein
LNSTFDVFAKNVFAGYNVPIEIPILRTSSEYRYIVDFILTDENNNITIVELEDLTSLEWHKSKLKNWAHYYSPYTFLAEQFDKKIQLLVIDPENLVKLTAEYAPSRFADDYKYLCNMLMPIETGIIYHNLLMCDKCPREEECDKAR